jgi:hypothetical protein
MDVQEIKRIYNIAEKEYNAKIAIDNDIKEAKAVVQTRYAERHNLKKRNGDLDTAQVKFAVIEKASQKLNKEKNGEKIDVEIALRDEYLANMKNGEEFFPLNDYDSYKRKKATADDLTASIKSIKDAEIDKGSESEYIDEIFKLANENVKSNNKELSEKDVKKLQARMDIQNKLKEK